MMSRIVYLLADVANPRNRDRLGIDFLAGEGHDVTVLDLSGIVHPDLARDRSCYSEQRQRYPVHTVSDAGELDGFLGLLAGADLVMNFAESGLVTSRHLPVFRLLARAGTSYLVQFVNAFPGWKAGVGAAPRPPAAERLRRAAQRMRHARPVESVLTRVPPRMLGVTPPRFQVLGGRQCEGFGRLADADTRRIYAHAMDYEHYRRVRDENHEQREIAVFIDEYLPYHPDIIMMGLDPPMPPEPYYRCLRNLFDRVERELNLEVVIAACPHADYRDKPEAFGGRRVEYFATARLVAESRLVIAHRSTAINFAVLFGKPLMLTATRQTYAHFSQTPYFNAFSAALAKQIRFIDDASAVDLDGVFEVDRAVYERYIEDFIKTRESPDLPFWRIVLDALIEAEALRPAA